MYGAAGREVPKAAHIIPGIRGSARRTLGENLA